MTSFLGMGRLRQVHLGVAGQPCRGRLLGLVDAYLTFAVDSPTGRFESAEVSLVANNLFDTACLGTIVENAACLGRRA